MQKARKKKRGADPANRTGFGGLSRRKDDLKSAPGGKGIHKKKVRGKQPEEQTKKKRDE